MALHSMRRSINRTEKVPTITLIAAILWYSLRWANIGWLKTCMICSTAATIVTNDVTQDRCKILACWIVRRLLDVYDHLLYGELLIHGPIWMQC
jgi:hypothetical protein